MTGASHCSDAWKNVGAATEEPDGWEEFATHDVKGFRAPYLSTSDGLVPAYAYLPQNAKPAVKVKRVGGFACFGLLLIPEGLDHLSAVIGIDYTLRSSFEGRRGRLDSKSFEDRTDAPRPRPPANTTYTASRPAPASTSSR